VWEEACARAGVPDDGGWFGAVQAYERDVLRQRG